MSTRRVLEVKVVHSDGSDPETFQLDIDDQQVKCNILVFRRPMSLTEADVNQLVSITRATTGNACGALILEANDKFEVYEVELPSRYDRERVI